MLVGAALHHRNECLRRWLPAHCCGASLFLVPELGQDFFPAVDSGQFRLHLRARSGTRIEETARLVDNVEHSIRKEIPAQEVAGILDNIGLPNSGISTSYQNNGTIGSARRSYILVSLEEGARAHGRIHAPSCASSG